MTRLLDWIFRRPVSVSLTVVALVLWGSGTASRLPLGLLPEVSAGSIVVSTGMEGMPAVELRQLVAIPLEECLAPVRGLARVESVCAPGRVDVWLDIAWMGDRAGVLADVREAVDAAYTSLPEGSFRPTVAMTEPARQALMVLAVFPASDDLPGALRLADTGIRAGLRQLDGVGRVDVLGGARTEIGVTADAHHLAAAGMTVHDLAVSIASSSVDMPAGLVRHGQRDLVAVTRNRAGDAHELSMSMLSGPGGAFRLSSVATVHTRQAPRQTLFMAPLDGLVREGVGIEVYRKQGADPVAVARRVTALTERLADEHAGQFDIVVIHDASSAAGRLVVSLVVSALISACVVALVLTMVLGDPLSAVLALVTLPLSTLATFGVLGLAGRSLNQMSLGGLTLAMGLVSDSAVVVLSALSGLGRRVSSGSVARAVGAVASGTFGGFLTTAVVFMPVVLMPGPPGELYGDLALSITAATGAGWLFAVFVLPAVWLAVHDVPARVAGTRSGGFSPESRYARTLKLAYRKPYLFIGVSVCMALAGSVMTLTRPLSFMPEGGYDRLDVRVSFPPSTRTDEMVGPAIAVCTAVNAVPGVGQVYGAVVRSPGAADRGLPPATPILAMDPYSVVCTVVLSGSDEDGTIREAVTTAVRGAMTAPGTESISVDIAIPPDPVAALLGLASAPSLCISASDRPLLESRVARFSEALYTTAGPALSSIGFIPEARHDVLVMQPRYWQAQSVGLSAAGAASVSGAATAGIQATEIDLDGVRTAVRVTAASGVSRLQPGADSGRGTEVRGALVPSEVPLVVAGGIQVPSRAFLDYRWEHEDAVTVRVDGEDAVYARSRPTQGYADALACALDSVASESPGMAMSDATIKRRYVRTMATTLALVLVALFLVLGVQTESVVHPLIIMTTIPLAMAGVGPALALTGTGLDSGSLLGMVVLSGVVVNASILLREAAADHAALPARVASYAAAIDRVRPILATTATTVLALVPALFLSGGSAQRSMSLAMLGGTLASTILSLFLVPVLLGLAGGRGGAGGRMQSGKRMSTGRVPGPES